MDNKISTMSATIALTALTTIVGLPEMGRSQIGQTIPAPQNTYYAPQIDSLTVNSVGRLVPGTELVFTLRGTPASTVALTLEGVAYNIPMREVEFGVYQGRYTLRSNDRITDNTVVRADLQRGEQITTARLPQPLTIAATNGPLGQNPSGQGLSANAYPNLSNTTGISQLPLEILSPQNNSQVNGAIAIRGRSAPNTSINVTVQARTSLVGVVGIDRNLLNRQITTDSQGNFSFSFDPNLDVPGTRYEVNLLAQRDNLANQETLVLYQQ